MLYQWQASLDSLTWANIPGATNGVYHDSITESIYLRCFLTTDNSSFAEATPGVFHFYPPLNIYNVTGGGPYCAGGAGQHVYVDNSDLTNVKYQLFNNAFPVGAPVDGTGFPIDFGAQTAAGTYSVEVIDVTTNCRAFMRDTVVITINPTPGNIMGSTGVCVGDSMIVTDDSTGGLWTSNDTTRLLIGSASGQVNGVAAGTATITYALTATGCFITKLITVNPPPAGITGNLNVCIGSMTALADAGSGTWSSGNPAEATVDVVTGVVTGVAAGSPAITYTLGTGCFTTTSVTVLPLPAAITGTVTVCVGLTAQLSDAIGGGSWSSSNTLQATVDNNGLYTGVSSGTPNITYTTPTGCTAVTMVTVNALPGSIAGNTTICANTTTNLTDAGGGTWSSSTSSVATIDPNTGTVRGVSQGTSTVTYTLPTGCIATTLFTVNPAATPITGTLTVCASGSTTQLSDGIGGGTWSSEDVSLATVGITTGIVTGVAAGNPVITYTLPTGCTATAVLTVTPDPTGITGTTTACAGTTSQLNDAVTGGVWSSNTSSVATIDPASGLVSATTGGTTTITYAAGACTTTTIFTVNPAATAIAGTLTVCAGGSTTQLSDGIGGGTWSSENVSLATVGVTTGLVTGVAAGTPVITYMLPTGCSATAVLTVTPDPTGITGTTTACAGTTSQLNDAVTGGVWSSNTSSVATIDPASGLVSATAGGTTTITYAVGACTITTIFTVNPAATAIAGTLTVCAGGSTTQLSDGIGGGTWSSEDVSLATVGVTTGLVTGVRTGTPVITFMLPSGCSATAVLTVTPDPTGITGTTTACAGTTSQLNDAVTVGVWSSNTSSVATIDPASGLVSATAGGTTTITYAVGACTTTTIFTVNPAATAIAGTLTVCAGGSTTQLSDGIGGGTWSSENVSLATVGVTTGLVTGVSTGTPVITYMLPTGCSATAVLTVTPDPTGITGTTTACAGTTSQLNDAVTGGVWSSNTSSVATIDPASGLVSATAGGTTTITYALGACTTTTIFTVNPAATAIAGTLTVCAGGSTTQLSDGIGGGTWSSENVSLATVGVTTGLVTGVAAGTPVITYMLPTGCSATAVLTVTPDPTGITGTTTACAGTTSQLNDAVTGGVWSSNTSSVATIDPASGLVSATAGGTTTITYAVGACTTTTIFTVNPAATAIAGTLTVCAGGSTTQLSDGIGGGTWSSENVSLATVGVTTGLVTGVAAGTPVITYMLPTGCTATAVVTVNAPPVTTLAGTSNCTGSFLTATTSASYDSVKWYDGATLIKTTTPSSSSYSIISVTQGDGVTPLNYTPGTFLTNSGDLYIVDYNNNRVLKYSAGFTSATLGTVVAQTGLSRPAGCYVDGFGNLYVASSSNNNVIKFPPGSTGLTVGTVVAHNGMNSPFGVQTDAAGNLFVASPASGLLYYPPGSISTTPPVVIDGGILATAIYVDANDTLYVADNSSQVYKYAPTLTPGVYTLPTTVIAGTGTSGSSNTQLTFPYDAVRDAAGNFYVSDNGNNRIMKFPANTTSGTAGVVVAGTGVGGDVLNSPTVIWVNSSNVLAVAEPVNNSVQVYIPGAAGSVTTDTLTTSASGVYTAIPYKNGCMGTSSSFTVNAAPASSIGGVTTVCAGSAAQLSNSVSGGTWSSSDNSLATVGLTTGLVTGVAAGTPVITYTLLGGCTATTVVTVNETPVAISGNTTICAGLTSQLTDAVSGGVWSSNTSSVATVDPASGLVSATTGGTTTITYAVGNCSTSILVTVNPAATAITGTLTVCAGATTQLSDGVAGGTWSSSNGSLATVGLSTDAL